MNLGGLACGVGALNAGKLIRLRKLVSGGSRCLRKSLSGPDNANFAVTILFPCHPLSPKKPEPDYECEFEAAIAAGFQTLLFSHEDLMENKQPPFPRGTGKVLHRTWMLPAARFAALSAALENSGYSPVVRLCNYELAHHYPSASRFLQGLAPWSRGMIGFEIDAAWELIGEDGICPRSLVVKDWVKSVKHTWPKGCLIPAGSSQAEFQAVLRDFIDIRGAEATGGFSFKEFYPIAEQNGVPAEFRVFFYEGEPFFVAPSASGLSPVPAVMEAAAKLRKFPSPFFTADFGVRRDNGNAFIIEVGDAGVSGLPDLSAAVEFYANLKLAAAV